MAPSVNAWRWFSCKGALRHVMMEYSRHLCPIVSVCTSLPERQGHTGAGAKQIDTIFTNMSGSHWCNGLIWIAEYKHTMNKTTILSLLLVTWWCDFFYDLCCVVAKSPLEGVRVIWNSPSSYSSNMFLNVSSTWYEFRVQFHPGVLCEVAILPCPSLRSSCSDPACGPSPAEKLTPQHLKLLRDAFTRPRPAAQKHDRIRKSRRADVEDGVRFEEFQQVLRTVIGPDIEDTWVDRFFCEVVWSNIVRETQVMMMMMMMCVYQCLCTQVDISCSGQVTWKQLCSYLLLEFTERERASVPTAALLQQPHVQHCSHNKVLKNNSKLKWHKITKVI